MSFKGFFLLCVFLLTVQFRKSGIIGIIFAILLLVILVGFLHLAIRLFFRVGCNTREGGKEEEGEGEGVGEGEGEGGREGERQTDRYSFIHCLSQPDWQPLVLQLEALKINLKQHTLSCLGIVTNALMQVSVRLPYHTTGQK